MPTMTTAGKPAAKNSILGGDAPRLAPIRPNRPATRLHQSAWGLQANGGADPAAKSGNPATGGKPGQKPAATARKTAAPALPAPTATTGIYWTCLTAPVSAGIRKAWELGPDRPEWPHSRLCSLQAPTALELMAILRTKGWQPGQFSDPEHCFARVELTADGFNVVRFPSYAAAVADDQARAELAELAARQGGTEVAP